MSKAYAVLSDKDKRNDYDRFGEDGLRASHGYAEPDVDADQMFRMFFGDSFFGNGTHIICILLGDGGTVHILYAMIMCVSSALPCTVLVCFRLWVIVFCPSRSVW